MQKVIGLDIGSYSIKAIEIINTFKSYEIVNFYETVVPALEGVPLDAVVPVCMEQLFKEHNIVADRIITAMPGQFISSRILEFQFSDPRKIEASVMVELEDHVPFNLDDMVIDHQILGPAGGHTLVLAVMTRKAFLKNFLGLLSRINIDPKLVDVDSLAFYNLSSHLHINPEEVIALVDIGHEKTSVCIVRHGVLRLFRSINLGGRYITEFLARDLECDYFSAQRVKHRVSTVLCDHYPGTDLGQDDREVADKITMAANAIVKELGRTFYAFKTWDKDPIDMVYLSGGTSKIAHLEELLTNQLELPVEKMTLQQAELKVSPVVAENIASIPQSLAIGLRAVTNIKKHSQINLRRGEFAYVQNYEAILKGASFAFMVLGFALSLLLLSYGIRYYFNQSQIDEIKEEYAKVVRSSFPSMKTGNMTFQALRREAESSMKTGIGNLRNSIFEFQMYNNSSPSLKLLKLMSEKIPKEVVIDVTLYEFRSTAPGVGSLILKAETDGFEAQSKVIDALKEITSLKNVEEKSSGTKPGSDGKKIEFTIQADYEA